ncbi:MAG: CDC48 family AAA ATPase [Nanoarchaeota archaeon]|nr:CDC48 family AAA ATPase [Nanoarchaeota archaeon]MBU4116126.1 CDC48 family AAA ATPase [Nanoarchaeota archaeon]
MKEDKKNKEIFLEVTGANRKYVGQILITLSSNDMERLGIVSGEIVQLSGEKKLCFRVIRVGEEFSGKIGLDGVIRSTLGVSVGEKILVSKIEKIPKLKSITLSVLEHDEFNKEQLRTFNSQLKAGEKFKQLLSNAPLGLGQKISILTNVGNLIYIVSKCSPKNISFGLVGVETKIDLSEEIGESSGTNVYYEDIGGLKEEIEKIREMIEFPMKHPDIFQRLGISAPKGVLLTGPPGTGKTLLAKAVATETDANFISIAGPEIMSKYHGGSEENLRKKFEDAEKNSPTIIFIDEVDAIAPKRGETHDQAEKRVVAQLLTSMDGLKGRGKVVVMAATNRPDDLDEALRRPGRFDRELRINPPTDEGRREILQIHTRNMPIENKEAVLDEFSKKTIGYTGADLEVLCKEAALKSVKPFYSELITLGEENDSKDNHNQEIRKQELLDKIKITREHFIHAMKIVEPSAMREVLIKKPHVKWTDIGGLDYAKEKLRELVELPLIRPDLYTMAGIKPSKGILLTGPPGTGKTLLVKAVANEANANFISVKGPELVSKWVGESEKHVREIFKKARQVAPCIIFFDEFDSISKMRGISMSDSTEKIVNQLLTELDGIEELEKVMVIAATNRRDLIDPALLRPGRIDSIVELEIPDEKTRIEIFKVHTKNMPLEKNVNINDYIKKTNNWTGADIEAVCRNAGINAIKKVYQSAKKEKLTITQADFDKALKEVAKQIGISIEDEQTDVDEKSEEKKDVIKKINKRKK